MKYLKIILVFLIALNSCATVNYVHEFNGIDKINMEEGHWLVNHIDAELYLNAKREFTEKLLRKLKKTRNENIAFIENLDIDTLGHEIIKFQVSDTKLSLLGEFTDFDYLLNTKLMIVPGRNPDYALQGDNKETVIYRTIFHIYDLSTGKIVFEQVAEITDKRDIEKGDSNERGDLKKLYKSLKQSVRLIMDSPSVNVSINKDR